MGTKKETMDYLLSKLEGAGEYHAKKMFGEYGLYLEDRMLALVCDDQLFVKPTKAGADYLGDPEEGQPYPGAKNWYLIPEDQWEDALWLQKLMELTFPEVNPVKKKAKKKV